MVVVVTAGPPQVSHQVDQPQNGETGGSGNGAGRYR